MIDGSVANDSGARYHRWASRSGSQGRGAAVVSRRRGAGNSVSESRPTSCLEAFIQ